MKIVRIVCSVLFFLVCVARLFIPNYDVFGNTNFWLFEQLDYVKMIFEEYNGFNINMIFEMGPYFVFLVFDLFKVIISIVLIFVTIFEPRRIPTNKVCRIALVASLFPFIFTPSVAYGFGTANPSIDLTTIILFLPMLFIALHLAFDTNLLSAIPNRVLGCISYIMVVVAMWLSFGTFTTLDGLIFKDFWSTILFCLIAVAVCMIILKTLSRAYTQFPIKPNMAGLLCILVPLLCYGLIIVNYEGVGGISVYVDFDKGNLQLLVPIIIVVLLVINTMICIIRKKSNF